MLGTAPAKHVLITPSLRTIMTPHRGLGVGRGLIPLKSLSSTNISQKESEPEPVSKPITIAAPHPHKEQVVEDVPSSNQTTAIRRGLS